MLRSCSQNHPKINGKVINADDMRKSQQGQTENSASGDPKVKREDLQSEIYNHNREQFTCAIYLTGETVGRDTQFLKYKWKWWVQMFQPDKDASVGHYDEKRMRLDKSVCQLSMGFTKIGYRFQLNSSPMAKYSLMLLFLCFSFFLFSSLRKHRTDLGSITVERQIF